MKYQIEYCPNPHCIKIYVRQRLIKGSILCTDHMDISDRVHREILEKAIEPEKLKSFIEIVNELDGMEPQTSFGRYNIQMLKAEIFSWEELLPLILSALQTFVASDGTLEQIAPPTQWGERELGQSERYPMMDPFDIPES